MENGENKTTSFPLGTLKTWEVTGKKAVVIGLVDAHTLAFETKVRHDKNLWQACRLYLAIGSSVVLTKACKLASLCVRARVC